jgi:hypothetical protein
MNRARQVLIFPLAAALALSTAAANAADKTTVVKFAPGTTSSTISDALKGYDMNIYVLGANAGQTLSVTFQPSNASCYYNVEAPGAEEALSNGSVVAEDYSGVLPVSGDYRIKTYLMRNAARRNETCKFSISFEIRD